MESACLKRHLTLCLIVAIAPLWLGTALKADTWAPVEKKIITTEHQYGDVTLEYKVDPMKDAYFPKRTVTVYHKDVVKAHLADIEIGVIAASPDQSHFVILSNRGPSKMAFYVFDSKGRVIKQSSHEEMEGRLFDDWSVTVVRSWYQKEPKVQFEFDAKDLKHVYVSGSTYKRLDLMADNLGIDFNKDTKALLTTKALIGVSRGAQDVDLLKTRLSELLKELDQGATPELNAEIALMIPTLLDFHTEEKTTESAADLIKSLAASKSTSADKARDILSGIAANEREAERALENMKIVDHHINVGTCPQSMKQLKSGGKLTDEGIIHAFKDESADPKPYHGYYFKFLRAPEGSEDFGILVFPETYGITGRRLIFHHMNGTYYLESEGLEKSINLISDIKVDKWIKKWCLRDHHAN